MPPAPPPRRGDGSPLRLCSSGPRHEFIIIPSEAHCSAFGRCWTINSLLCKVKRGQDSNIYPAFPVKTFPE